MNSQPKPSILFDRKEIEKTVRRLAGEITDDYHAKHPLMLGILKGSFIFMADLVRLINIPVEIEFIRLSSYGQGRSTAGEIKMVHGLRTTIVNRDIIIVEDIVDTGLTTSFLIDYLWKRKARSVKLCTLTDKPSRRKIPVNIDYLGFTVPNKFIVGYGIDWDEKFRYLPDICFVEVKG
ncbi:MAG: hypoxanthine phosphoribosyltransferase [Dehalococcoidales bacterium]|nr:hypoxanthine phosphoribosyltransferase [Dehalococcoidales bacterium]